MVSVVCLARYGANMILKKPKLLNNLLRFLQRSANNVLILFTAAFITQLHSAVLRSAYSRFVNWLVRRRRGRDGSRWLHLHLLPGVGPSVAYAFVDNAPIAINAMGEWRTSAQNGNGYFFFSEEMWVKGETRHEDPCNLRARRIGRNTSHMHSVDCTELCKNIPAKFRKSISKCSAAHPKWHYGAIFQRTTPKSWQECFYTTLYFTHFFRVFAPLFLADFLKM